LSQELPTPGLHAASRTTPKRNESFFHMPGAMLANSAARARAKSAHGGAP
jgi:hypothetical protein